MSIESIMNVYTNLPARDRSVTEIREELIFGVCVGSWHKNILRHAETLYLVWRPQFHSYAACIFVDFLR